MKKTSHIHLSREYIIENITSYHISSDYKYMYTLKNFLYRILSRERGYNLLHYYHMKGIMITMKIDTAIKEFIERYDEEAIKSIHDISHDYSRTISEATIKAFEIQKGFDMFCEFLEGYGNYKIKNKNNWTASPQDAIITTVDKFINNGLFKECDLLYPEIDGFVKGYVEGVKQLTECVENVKQRMTDEGVDLNCVGAVNDFADKFMIKLHESFDPTMERFLWASGYNGRKVIFGGNDSPYEKKKKVESELPIFI